MKFKEGQKVQLSEPAPSRYSNSRVGEKGTIIDAIDEGDPTDNYYIIKLEDGSEIEALERSLKLAESKLKVGDRVRVITDEKQLIGVGKVTYVAERTEVMFERGGGGMFPNRFIKPMKEGFNKPGARGTIKTRTCPTCKGKGTPSLTLPPEEGRKRVPCKTCKGTGEVWTSVPYPGQEFPYKTDTASATVDEKVRQGVAGQMDDPQLSDDERLEVKKHIKNLPPAKVAHLAKTLTEMIQEAEQMWCPKCKQNVTPENDVCPTCGSQLEPPIDELNTTGAIGGYNAPLGAKYKTDDKGIKHNFRVREMKTLKRLAKEAANDVDLSTKEKTLTNLLYSLSKQGELQKQFSGNYDKNKFLSWLKQKAAEVGAHVSSDYWNALFSRLKGNPKSDLFTIYNAAMAGSGLGVTEDKKLREYTDDEE